MREVRGRLHEGKKRGLSKEVVVARDDLVVEIARGLAGLSDLPADWASLAMVFRFRGGSLPSSFGYAYAEDGEWTAISGDMDALEDNVAALRAALKAESGREWLEGLFRLKRTGEVTFEFAYEQRWKVTPANLDEMIGELKP